MANELAAPDPALAIDGVDNRKPPRESPFWALLGWGSAACLAVVAVALVSQTNAGAKRLQLAFSDTEDAAAPVIAKLPLRPPLNDAESKRLAAQLRELASDRERLTVRIATLEHALGDMTGSIRRQDAQIAAATLAPRPSVAATAPVASVAAPAPPEAAAPAKDDLPFFMEVRNPQAIAMLEAPTPAPAARATAEQPAVAREAPAPTSSSEIGVDLGGAPSVGALRELWADLKANYGPLLAGLNPLIVQHAKHPSGISYRLVAGPLASSEDAAQFCAHFPILRTGCHPAKFTGMQLAEH